MLNRTITRLATAGAALALILAAGAVAPMRASAASAWSSQISGTTHGLRAIAFVDADRGWAVGDLGTIIATIDGGTTWSAQSSGTTMGLHAVSFSDASSGWAVGAEATIVSTHDGGASWSAQIADVPAGFAPFYTLAAVSFVDGLHGLAGGNSSSLQSTSDGGATWTRLVSSGQGCISVSAFTGIQFIDGQHAVGVGGHPSGITCRTADGGRTWASTGLGPSLGLTSSVYGPSFLDAANGWAVSGSSAMSTTDGGLTWTLRPVRGAGQLRAVSFIDARTGWVVGDGGAIFATRNGGHSWSQVASGTAADLLGIASAAPGRARAAGSGGTIVAFDGGHGPARK